MKKYFTFGLIMSLVSGACFAEHPMITQLIREKQQKMEKLEKCKGTTKNLKIAGISTLGITAVGVGANIAEAVVLSNTKEDVKKAKVARDEQLRIKENRQEFIEMCNEIGGQLLNNQKECYKLCFEETEYNTLLSLIQQEADISCKIITNTTTEKKTSCVDKDKHLLSLQLTPRNGQSQGEKEQGSGQAGNGNQQGNGGKDGKQGDAGNKGGANGGQGGQQGGKSGNKDGGQDNQGDKTADDENVPVEQLPTDGSVVVKNCRTAWGESYLNKTANVYHCDNDRDYVNITLDEAKTELREFYNAIKCDLAFAPTLMADKAIYTNCAKNTAAVAGYDYILINYAKITCPYGYKLNESSARCDKVDVSSKEFADACGVISGSVNGNGCKKELYPTTEDDYAQAVEQLKSHKSTLSGSDYGFDCEIEGDNTALSCTKGSYEIMEWVYDNNVNCGNGTFNPVTGKCEEAPDAGNGNDKQDYKTYTYDCDVKMKADYEGIKEGLIKCNNGKGFQGGDNFEQIKGNQWKQTIDEEKTIRIWTLNGLYCDDGYALVRGLCEKMSANAIAKQKEIDEATKQMDAEFDAMEKKIEQNSDPKTVCEKVGGGQYTVYGLPLRSENTYLSYCNNINEAKCNEVIREYTGTFGHFEWKDETFFTGGYKQNEYLSYDSNPDTVETKCWFYNR